MAVLVEAISVVLRRDSIDRAFPGGWQRFVTTVPNATLCFDDNIARVGFMNPQDSQDFIDTLWQNGLRSGRSAERLTGSLRVACI